MTVNKSDIEIGFYRTAKNVLNNLKISPMQLLKQNPRSSKKELAVIIGHGVTVRGLTMLFFEEARQSLRIRGLAKDLLYRKIVAEYPDGWYYNDKVHASVKLGGWLYDMLEFAPEYEHHATAILRELTITKVPETGWKPENTDDERLRLVFDEHWPIDE